MRFVIVGLMALLSVQAGCGVKRLPEGTVKLMVEGEESVYHVDALEVFELHNPLQGDPFEIVGPGFSLVGATRPDSNFGEGEGWKAAAGTQFGVEPRGGNPQGRKDSKISLPRYKSPSLASGGFVIVEKHERIGDRDILSGRLWLILDTDEGQKQFEGLFRIRARIGG